jgi:large subunit ribosomal protein L35
MASKLKSNSGAKKRFRVTASGKVKRKNCNLAHILTTHSKKVKRGYRKKSLVSDAEMPAMRKLMPYSF